MPKPNNKPAPKPAPLTWDEISSLAGIIGLALSDHPETAACLMVLMNDIGTHPEENQETIANILMSHVFMWQPESDKAEHAYVERERRRLLKTIKEGAA